MDKELTKLLKQAIQEVRQSEIKHGAFDGFQLAIARIDNESLAQMRVQSLDDLGIRMWLQAEKQDARVAASESEWLFPLPPQYQHLPPEIQADSLEQFDERIGEREKLISVYNQPRCSPENLKRLEVEMREMKRLRSNIATHFAGDPAMNVGKATALFLESLETPIARRNRALASKGGIAKNRRTKNQ